MLVDYDLCWKKFLPDGHFKFFHKVSSNSYLYLEKSLVRFRPSLHIWKTDEDYHWEVMVVDYDPYSKSFLSESVNSILLNRRLTKT